MEKKVKSELRKRIESLLIRTAIVACIAALNYLVQSLTDFGLNEVGIGLVSLVVAELTKFLNNKYNLI